MKKISFGLLFVVVAFSIFIGSSNSVKAQLIPANPACYNFTRDLSAGGIGIPASVGTDVVALQMFLESRGYLVMPAGVPMGSFGTLTQSALASYQASVGLTASGYFGPMTRAIMVSECEGMATSQGVIVRTVSSDSDTDEMVSTIAHDDVGIFTISYDVTAFDRDIYFELGTATRGTTENNTGANFIIQDAANSYSPTSTGAIRLADLTRVSGGSTTGNFVKIAAGQTAQLQLDVTFDPGHGAATSEGYRMLLHSINYAFSPIDATEQKVLAPETDYRTGAVSIGDGSAPISIPSNIKSITMTSPTGGNLFTEETQRITWNTTNVPATDTVKIILARAGYLKVLKETKNTGQAEFTIPSDVPASDPTKPYYLMLQAPGSLGAGSVIYGRSQSTFVIYLGPKLEITGPVTGGSTFNTKTNQPFRLGGSFGMNGAQNGSAVEIIWYFGDGTSYTERMANGATSGGAGAPEHSFSKAGTYTMYATLKSTTGKITTSKTVTAIVTESTSTTAFSSQVVEKYAGRPSEGNWDSEYRMLFKVKALEKDVYIDLGFGNSIFRGKSSNPDAAVSYIIENSGVEVTSGNVSGTLYGQSGGTREGNYLKIKAGEEASLRLLVRFQPTISGNYNLRLYSLNYNFEKAKENSQHLFPKTSEYATSAFFINKGEVANSVSAQFVSSDADVDEVVSTDANDDKGIFSIEFDVTANGEDAYVELGTATRGTTENNTGANFLIYEASNGSVVNTGNITLSDLTRVSGGTQSGNFVKIGAGQTAQFELEVIFDPAHLAGTSVPYRMVLHSVNFAKTPIDATSQYLATPASIWKTGVVSVGDGSTTVNTAPKIITLPTVPRRIQTGQSVSFTWGATDAENDNLRWAIDWGNGGSGGGGGSNCTQSGLGWSRTSGTTYNTPGTYTVKATVTDCAGLSTSYSFDVTVISTLIVVTDSILIESPNGQEVFKAGTSMKIEFRSTAAGINHAFDLISEANGSVTSVGQKVITTAGAQVFSATIPANLPAGRYMVRVCINCELATKVFDTSDGNFRIDPASNLVPISSRESQVANVQSALREMIQALRVLR